MVLRTPIIRDDELDPQVYPHVSQPIEPNIHSILALEEEIRGHEVVMGKLKRSRESLLSARALPPQSQQTDETDIGSIRALEERITKHQRPIIQLKRAQNSLLRISRLPPEILGAIFWRSAIPDGFEKRSHNFLLVCHHWFEIASCTPEIQSFWGDNLRDWEKRHVRYPEIPLDLVLSRSRFTGDILDSSLQDALRDRALRDTIRCIHLRAVDGELLISILIPLTPNDVRHNSVESLILRNEDDTPINTSKFFAYNRSPKLQHLELTNCTISSWDHLISQTSALTTLVLHLSNSSPPPTTPQLFSILASNPALRKVVLTGRSVPKDGGGNRSRRVSLRHLEELELAGKSQDVVGLLRRLKHPERVHLGLTLYSCAAEDTPDTVGPYLRDYLRRRGTPKNELGLYVASGDGIVLHVGDAAGLLPSISVSQRMVPFVSITVITGRGTLPEKIILGLIAHTPQEEIVYLRTHGNPTSLDNIYSQLPNLRTLHSARIPLSAVFQKPKANGDDRVPRLQRILLERVVADGGDWTPLTTFLSRRAFLMKRPNSFKTLFSRRASGSVLVEGLDSLEITQSSYMRSEVAKDVSNLVHDFRTDRVGTVLQ